ncbi:MAG: UDP-N-acetylmuramate dehydrogenase [Acidimicrobiales bacterium]
MTSAALAAAGRLLGDAAVADVAIGEMTTYRVGGRAGLFVEVTGEDVLERLCRTVSVTATPVLVLGKGSNLLVSDSGFEGIAVHLAEHFSELSILGGRVDAGAAMAYPVLARRCAAAGLTGMEWAVGVPGSVGGAVRMNAGGHGAETSERLMSAQVLDLSSSDPAPREFGASELAFSYRRSSIGPGDLVLSAAFELPEGNPAESSRQISEIVKWRRENQPGGQNAGSVFTNPPGESAGALIDSAGMKGFRLGTASVSEKHANFIQADPGGSADDVRRLIDVVQQVVHERAGVDLTVEVHWVGP